ncbi:zinc metallopeptidase [Parendozoicomonas haliclonae]|uniref:Putative neutral zinc metallopeptidase n=1 Tax=Parendozoicomonas haliclonae TaxID=1960125 RepID=A0A1X7AJ38_9GAMM|nr:zinc metallopeptidase [Parendozoicomonas haliclonae]SMA45473.1 putative neutral zinc metallopeptidase [Parendozoicomonas haliclonae]
MHFALLALAILALVFGPQIWINHVLRKYNRERPDLPGTGGELAQHLIERFELDASVLMGGKDDNYYDPAQRIVFLSPDYYDARSITAVAMASRLVGYAMQHAEEHPGFLKRYSRLSFALRVERFSAIALMITPVIFLLTRVPHSTLLTIVIGASGMLAAIWVQILNLPVEKDASYNKAQPILEEGYLSPVDIPGARRVLKAAAFSYVAAAMTSLLNLGRWFSILRR